MMDLGIQLYGCMSEFRKNPEKYFKQLASFGYTKIEPCMALGISSEEIEKLGINPIWQPEETRDYFELMTQYGLEIFSCHVFGDPIENIDILLDIITACQIKQIVVNCPQNDLALTYPVFADHCHELASRLQKNGIELWLHNGFQEIRTKVNDKSIYELILEHCQGAMGAQIDVGWVQFGGEDPVKYMKRILPYLRSVHYKDLKNGYENMAASEIHICLGDGSLPIKEICEFVLQLDVSHVIDQDESQGDILDDFKRSAAIFQI